MIVLGQLVYDLITGCEGVAIAKAEYLNGGVLIQVQPKRINPDGTPVDACWFDEQRLDLCDTCLVSQPAKYIGF